MTRIWDQEGKYEVGLLREYQHWALEVSFRQHTLGCCILFAKRNVEKISELTEAELIELKTVMKDYETLLSQNAAFKPDRFNYLQLGNAVHHLHFHAVPRYATSRNFFGQNWNDPTFGHPPTWSTVEVEKELVVALKKSLLS